MAQLGVSPRRLAQGMTKFLRRIKEGTVPLPHLGGVVALGLVLLVLGFWFPAHLKAVHPRVLEKAGGTNLVQFGQKLLTGSTNDIRLGPAKLIRDAARGLAQNWEKLEKNIIAYEDARKDLVRFGGTDRVVTDYLNIPEIPFDNQPILFQLIPEAVRTNLTAKLKPVTLDQGFSDIMQTRMELKGSQMRPATQPGGEATDAVILMTALVYSQATQDKGSLRADISKAAAQVKQFENLRKIEPFYLAMMALGQRLDWVQLRELVKLTPDAQTLIDLAHVIHVEEGRVVPKGEKKNQAMPLIYAASLLSEKPGKVASHLMLHGRAGLHDIREAMSYGKKALVFLLDERVRINTDRSWTLGTMATFALKYPNLALFTKYLLLALGCGVFMLVAGLLAPRTVFDERQSNLTRFRRVAITVTVVLILIAGTEPFLLQKAMSNEYRSGIRLPTLSTDALAAVTTPKTSEDSTMGNESLTSSIIAIVVFLLIQIGVYVTCIMKIRDIESQAVDPLLKLRLLENEENLFDMGLYVGIGGTALALVFQVTGLITANLLAAYASNMFGILCVAIVKIWHVRQCKKRLILEAELQK